MVPVMKHLVGKVRINSDGVVFFKNGQNLIT